MSMFRRFAGSPVTRLIISVPSAIVREARTRLDDYYTPKKGWATR